MKSLLLSFLLAIPALAFSQKEDVRAEIHFQGNAFYHEFRPYEFVGSVGYNITDRFFVNVRGESTVALFKINGLKDYYTNVMYGANVGYTFLKNDFGNFDWETTCAASKTGSIITTMQASICTWAKRK